MDNYTTKIVSRNLKADESLLGVQLGRLCISSGVSVADVAQALNVSKPTVYKWFVGGGDVGRHLRIHVEEFQKTLLQKVSCP